MRNNSGTWWKALALFLVVLMFGGLLLGGAALWMGASRYRSVRWADAWRSESDRESIPPMMHWRGPGRFLAMRPFLCGFGPLLRLAGLVLILGLIARLFRRRGRYACGCPRCCGAGGWPGHPHHGPHGHGHHGPHGHGYHEHHGEHAGETPEANEPQPGDQETQEFRVG